MLFPEVFTFSGEEQQKRCPYIKKSKTSRKKTLHLKPLPVFYDIDSEDCFYALHLSKTFDEIFKCN